MNGIVHPRASEFARSHAVSVEDAQWAIMQSGGDLELAEDVVRVFVMANQWPDVPRMIENRRIAAANKAADVAAASLNPPCGTVVLP